MARLLKIKEIEDRKKALIAESELYRQTLGVQIQHLRLYSAQVRAKFSLLALSKPLLRFGLPLLLRRRRAPKMSMIGAGLLAWRVGRKIVSLFPGLVSRLRRKREERAHRERSSKPT